MRADYWKHGLYQHKKERKKLNAVEFVEDYSIEKILSELDQES